MLREAVTPPASYGMGQAARSCRADTLSRCISGIMGTVPKSSRPAWILDPDTGCWLWNRGLNLHGYGQYGAGRKRLAHRVYYERYVGPIPLGLVMDHLCRVRRCVHPLHMEPVTQTENKLRGLSPNAINARKRFCLNGHEFTPENTYRRPDKPSQRNCVACKRARHTPEARHAEYLRWRARQAVVA